MLNTLSVSEAAKMLNVNRKTMLTRIRRGLIPAKKDNLGNWRIQKTYILQILNWGRSFSSVIQTLKKRGINPLNYYEGES